MGQNISECKSCKITDPVASTVKVDPTLLAAAEGLKAHQPTEHDAHQQQESEQKRLLEEKRAEKERLEAEEERLHRLAEEEEQEEAQKRAEDARRHAEEEVERLRREEAELAQKAAHEERQRAAEQQAKADAARAAAAQPKAEAEAAQKVVDKFLKTRGFKNLQTPRKAFCGGAAYPFHLAAQEGNADLVKAMLLCGANREQKNGAKLSPLQAAEKHNKKGSHDQVVELLRA